MAIVTDKQYHIEDQLKTKFDFCIKRTSKNFDHLFIVDGDEGYGKTTAVVGWAYYIAHTTGRSFNLDNNMFFDLNKLIDFATKTEEQVIVWDEAALGGLSMQWQSKLQQKLIQLLMIARKKRHFWFFLIPKFFRLNEYIVVDRAVGLIHVYSQDDINRGSFVYFDRKRKNKLYYLIKKTKERNYTDYEFQGRFVQKGCSEVIDEEEYNKKKDQAIIDAFKEIETDGERSQRIIKLKYKLATDPLRDMEDKAKYYDIPIRTLYDWSNLNKKYENLD